MKKFLRICAIITAVTASCALEATQVPPSTLLKILNNNPPSIQGSGQVIIVTGTNSSSYGLLYAFEKVKDMWQTQFIPMWVVIGKNGIAGEGMKIEGDLSTPAGTFPIAKAAGTESIPETRLDYIHWKDGIPGLDVLFPPSRGHGGIDVDPSRAQRGLHSFRYCILLGRGGKEPSPGDSLMLHLWPGQKNYTAGTIGISEINMLKLLKWLDRDKNPVLVTGTAQSIQSLP